MVDKEIEIKMKKQKNSNQIKLNAILIVINYFEEIVN